ncbi:alpha-L-fucosidase [Dyella flagellata]|uniref:alpha-L-fucosidase n=1 Tax=Dyella flagellata TaxID=1867833 RepID=A0ABQ5XFR3_9GAMM|nr:alpha-L-fucosidase [Dyella flagellata]GLQ89933.1 alpha-L-fucosidase [Dyella flagellata]
MPKILLAAALAATLFAGSATAQNFADVKPAPQQTHWQDLQFGVIVHFGTNTFLDREWGDGTADPKVFNPDHVDPDQWARAARSAGAKYLLLVAKHHDGFALWPTEQSNYSVKSSPWLGGKGDLVRMTADAVHKEGMEFGIYLSPWDRHEPRYKDSAAYDKFYMAQMDELVQGYGPLVEWWLDGAGSAGHVYDFKKYMEELRTYQSNTMVFADVALFGYGDIRWVGQEDGHIRGENWNVIDRHGELRWRPVEVDTPLHKLEWFWHPDADQTLKSVDELMDIWENSVGRGGQLMLGLAPNRHGLLPDADVKRLKEFGGALQARYGADKNLVLHRLPSPSDDPNLDAALDGNLDTFWSAPEGSHHAVLEVDFAHPITFDHALTMEWLNDGQCVQNYAIEAWTHDTWAPVAKAEAIGHMKIDRFAPITTSKVRLNVLSSACTARIREFQLFDVEQKR